MAHWHSSIMCKKCWVKIYGQYRQPFTIKDAPVELCCYCRKENSDGIRVRNDAKLLHCQHYEEKNERSNL